VELTRKRSTGYSLEGYGWMYIFDQLAHPCHRDGPAAKNLRCIFSDFPARACDVPAEQSVRVGDGQRENTDCFSKPIVPASLSDCSW
jgi:hypothetical protein